MRMLTLRELTIPANRLVPGSKLPARPNGREGEDILMSNVVSFEVKFTGTAGAASFAPGVTWPRPLPGNLDYPYDTLPVFPGATNPGEFDTFTSQVPNWFASTNLATINPNNPSGAMKSIRITGVKVHLRAWDSRTLQSRQTTLVQDL
jgi:hypothetical protein